MNHILFASLVYQSRLNSRPAKIVSELLIEAEQIKNADKKGLSWSKKNYPGGYTSYGSMDQLHQLSSTFEKLRKEIDGHVVQFVSQLEMDISSKALQMNSCWLNIMPKGTSHSLHLHPLSVISGSFYVEVPENSSGIKFEDPRLMNFMASPPRKKTARLQNQNFFEIKPSAGDLILFESWMKHEVPRNKSNKNRISISFNYDWVKK
ncbi:MAG: TIGR02466 family protein [Bdellovibrionota bacterium]